jgi:hypothetical protein
MDCRVKCFTLPKHSVHIFFQHSVAQKAIPGLPFIFVYAAVTDRSLGDEVWLSLDRLNPSYVRPIALEEEPVGIFRVGLRSNLAIASARPAS